MKKILITGANSYIGTSFEDYVRKNYFSDFKLDTVDMLGDEWRNKDFSEYDVIFHVAGIAHSEVGKASDEVKAKYYDVNTHLAVETAKKAKADGVGQFIFMSSIIVFGSKNEHITFDTEPNPDNFYGNSKLLADIEIHKLEDESFKVVSVRSPMIYGYDSRGNYPVLAKFAKRTPVFPKYANKRSMIYIENLCEFVVLMAKNNETGYFYPQNAEYVNTSDMVRQIALTDGKNILLTKIFNPMIWIFKDHPIMRKVFGDMYYDKSMSEYKEKYSKVSFEESINKSESGKRNLV